MLVSPLLVPVSKKSKFSLNLNVYRNAHHHTLNKAKIVYKEYMQEQILKLPFIDVPVSIHFTLYARSKRLVDLSNVLSIHDKFFCDALVEYEKIEDDNYLWIPSIKYCLGGIDKENPRVEITIKEF